jgi:hypothetical protein
VWRMSAAQGNRSSDRPLAYYSGPLICPHRAGTSKRSLAGRFFFNMGLRPALLCKADEGPHSLDEALPTVLRQASPCRLHR